MLDYLFRFRGHDKHAPPIRARQAYLILFLSGRIVIPPIQSRQVSKPTDKRGADTCVARGRYSCPP